MALARRRRMGVHLLLALTCSLALDESPSSLGIEWYFIMSPVMVSTPSAPGPASDPLRQLGPVCWVADFESAMVQVPKAVFRDQFGRHALRQLGPVCWVADFESAMVHGVEGALILIL
eukprot:s3483_g11.t1